MRCLWYPAPARAPRRENPWAHAFYPRTLRFFRFLTATRASAPATFATTRIAAMHCGAPRMSWPPARIGQRKNAAVRKAAASTTSARGRLRPFALAIIILEPIEEIAYAV